MGAVVGSSVGVPTPERMGISVGVPTPERIGISVGASVGVETPDKIGIAVGEIASLLSGSSLSCASTEDNARNAMQISFLLTRNTIFEMNRRVRLW